MLRCFYMQLSKHKDFNEQIINFHQGLKTIYLQKVEEADNKKYAKAFYRSTVFEKNPNLPKNSFFFDTLSRLLLHNYRLNKENAILNTFNELYLIREKAEIALDISIELLAENLNESSSIYEIETESYIISLDLPQLTRLLALYLATRKLMTEFPKDEGIELFSLDMPLLDKKSTHNRKLEASVTFTESQQILSLHFLLSHVGLQTRTDHSLADFTRFTHLLSRSPITKVDNSPKLKSIKRLLDYKSNHPTLKDLEFILPFFKNIGLEGAVKLIEQEIKAKKEEI